MTKFFKYANQIYIQIYIYIYIKYGCLLAKELTVFVSLELAVEQAITRPSVIGTSAIGRAIGMGRGGGIIPGV